MNGLIKDDSELYFLGLESGSPEFMFIQIIFTIFLKLKI